MATKRKRARVHADKPKKPTYAQLKRERDILANGIEKLFFRLEKSELARS